MISHDATAAKATAGSVTAATGLATYLEAINGALGIAATVLGILLTSWLIFKEVRQEINRRKANKGKLQRRATDGVEDHG